VPPTVTKRTVCPASSSSRARPASAPVSSRLAARTNPGLPTPISLPFTEAVTPPPVVDRKPSARASVSPRSAAARTTAPASGCSLFCSTEAARCRSSSSPNDPLLRTSVTAGLPWVSVPVLSNTTVSTRSIASRASAFRIRIPSPAPRPTPTMMAMGVARPRAQGQAMISTDTALTSAYAIRGSGPIQAQTTNVAAATARTVGTKTEATRSATAWMGARLRCASATMRTICDSTVSAPTFVARIRKAPDRLIVPPVTESPGSFSAGRGSPVIIASSTALLPSVTCPSTGIFSPGRTLSRSPGVTSSIEISRSSPPRTTRAVRAASPINSRIALPVRLRARSSSTCPSRTSTTIVAAASKYRATSPWWRNDCGNAAGQSAAITLYT